MSHGRGKGGAKKQKENGVNIIRKEGKLRGVKMKPDLLPELVHAK